MFSIFDPLTMTLHLLTYNNHKQNFEIEIFGRKNNIHGFLGIKCPFLLLFPSPTANSGVQNQVELCIKWPWPTPITHGGWGWISQIPQKFA